jgi:DNA ligase-associated metallophosphoesterase
VARGGRGIIDLTIQLAGHDLSAMPERTLWWPATRTLVLADMHLGKDEGLRRAGAPIPRGGMESDLARLAAAIARTAPARIAIVGDLVHGRIGLSERTIETVVGWRGTIDAPIILVAGNHEASVGGERLAAALRAWRIDHAGPRLTCGGITLVHDPTDAVGPSICGHLHPVVRVGRRRAPVFARTGERLVLPAFSAFTTGAAVGPDDADELLVCAEDRVISLARQARR